MKPELVLDATCPASWLRQRALRVFENSTQRSKNGDVQLSASQKLGVVPQEMLMQEEDQKYMLALSGTDNFKHVSVGDFVISLRSFEGGFEYSSYNGCVSPAYTVLRPKISLHSQYWKHLFKSSIFKEMLASFNVGVRDGKSIRYDDFSKFVLPLPSKMEQKVIGEFLDRETARIDALVAKKTRFIELLREKRQALITHAVTKGLDPNVKMKDSGVEWLGAVPEHWGISPLKHLVRFRSGGTPSKDNLEFWDGDIPWASAKDLKQEMLADTIDHLTESAIESGAASLVPSGSILVVVRGMILARLFPVVETLVPMAINQDLKALVPSEKLNSRYLAHLLRGSSAESLSRLEEAGHGTKALRMENWVSIELPVPPLHEQLAIIAMLDIQTARIDSLAEKTARSIELLKERRSALITAAVTGQIDLREAV